MSQWRQPKRKPNNHSNTISDEKIIFIWENFGTLDCDIRINVTRNL